MLEAARCAGLHVPDEGRCSAPPPTLPCTRCSCRAYLQASGGGRIRGTYPVDTCGTRSTGVEMELTAQPFMGLSVSLNAFRTFASQTRLSPEFVAAITDLYERLILTNAGDMRFWWAGDTETIGRRFSANIWAPYQFQVLTNGKTVSEMSPWRFDAVVNYTFDETLFDGKLKGFNVVVGYRWQKAPVIGYLITDSTDSDYISSTYATTASLDPDLPVYGEGKGFTCLALDTMPAPSAEESGNFPSTNMGDSPRIAA